MVRIQKIGARYVDLELTVGENRRARIVERPGLWMSRCTMERTVSDLREVVRDAVTGSTLDYGVLTGNGEPMTRAVLTILYEEDTRRPIAFNAMSLIPVDVRGRKEEVLHLGLVVVDPGSRSQGFSWILSGLGVMLLFFRRQMRPLWVSSVTQVPAVVGQVDEGFTDVFPGTHPGCRRSHTHLAIARQIMAGHRHVFGVGEEAGFDPERFVITNAYTGGSYNLKKTYEEAPKHRLDVYNRMCGEQLDYERGDDFLQLGLFTFVDARRYLLRSVPRGSLGSVLYHGVSLALGSVVLPVLHWFTPGSRLGDLRPWNE